MDVWKLAADLGLHVVEHHGDHSSGYWPDEMVIRLTPGMTTRTTRSVLCHEIAHHILGHRPTTFSQVRRRQEHEANEWAASHLITPSAYAEAERHHGGHLGAIAHALDVAPELAAAFRNMLMRVGDAVYVQPRMGTGMWRHRVEVA